MKNREREREREQQVTERVRGRDQQGTERGREGPSCSNHDEATCYQIVENTMKTLLKLLDLVLGMTFSLLL